MLNSRRALVPLSAQRSRSVATLAAACVMLLGACSDSSPAPARPELEPGQDSADRPGASQTLGDSKADGGSTGLVGQLIWLEVLDGRVNNVASVLDLATGEETELWSTGKGTNVSDVSLSPDGSRIAYRVVEHEAAPPEAIVVRRLEPGAEPVAIAATETDVGRLTGYAWAPDGTGIAYGRQLGHLRVNEEGASPFELWELHLATAGEDEAEAGYMTDDRTVWSISGEELGPIALDVVAWSPDSGLVAITETPADGGASEFVRLIDTETGDERGRVPAGALQFDVVGSPDGRYVAMPHADVGSGHIGVLELATGEVHGVLAAAGSTPGAPVWSADSAWLGWTTQGCGGAVSGTGACTVGAVSLAELVGGASGATFERVVADENTRAVSFDPGGTRLLVAEPVPDEREWAGLAAHSLDGSGDTVSLPWQPPGGAWFAAWIQ